MLFGATVHNVKKCNNLNKILQIPLQMTRAGRPPNHKMSVTRPTSHA